MVPAEFCRGWLIAELAEFGSAIREDYDSESDIDLLVSFAPEARWSLLDHIEIEEEFSKLLGRPVDLVSKKAVTRSDNWIRRKSILENAQIIYATR